MIAAIPPMTWAATRFRVRLATWPVIAAGLLTFVCTSCHSRPHIASPSAVEEAAEQPAAPASAVQETAERSAPSDAELSLFLHQIYELAGESRFDEALQTATQAWSRGYQVADVAYTAACAASRTGKID